MGGQTTLSALYSMVCPILRRAAVSAPRKVSRRPNRKNSPFPLPEPREEIQQLLPWHVFLVQQPHPVFRLRARHDFSSRVHPFALQSAAHVTRRDSHPRIIPDALHFSRNADRIHVQFRVARIELRRRLRPEPHRRLHSVAAFLERFEIQIFLPGERRKSHGIAPAAPSYRDSHSMRVILPGSQTQSAPRPGRSAKTLLLDSLGERD